jgi:uncharacterized protein
MTTRTLTLDEARRIAVRAQLLDDGPPGDLGAVTDRLTLVQLDPTAAVAPSADLVLRARLGTAYSPDDLRRAAEVDRTLFELRSREADHEPSVAMLRPTADMPLYLAGMALRQPGGPDRHPWLDANDGFRHRVLELLRERGPLVSRDIPDTADLPWQSSGWTHDRNVTMLLELLGTAGEVAVAGRRGRQRVWDVADRVYPAGLTAVPMDEARRRRDARRLRALGLARARVVGAAGAPVLVEGTDGEWRLDPDATADGFGGRTVLLSPFDRLVHDRVRTQELFGYEYTLEMYKPKAQRRWGFFALPVLSRDRLVGKLDATTDRRAGRLVVHALHLDVPLDRRARAAVDAEVDALAAWLGLDGVSRGATSA